MLFDRRVAVQAPSEVRDSAGGVSYEFETVEGKESLPARIVAQTEEQRGERMTVIEDRYTVLLGGQHTDLTPDMVINAGDSAYNIIRIVPSGRLARPVTVVMAEALAI